MKKRLISTVLSASMVASMAASIFVAPVSAASNTETISYNYLYDAGTGYSPDTVHTRQMEMLNRGLVAVNTSEGIYLSWRLLDSEDHRYGSATSNVSFDIYRDNKKIATESNTTNYIDKDGTANSTYAVVPAGQELVTKVLEITENSVTITSSQIGTVAYAAKYTANGALDKVVPYKAPYTGEATFNTGFKADKVFIWDQNMKPIENSYIDTVTPLSNNYFDIPLTVPEKETIEYIAISAEDETQITKTMDLSFFPADCSTGDLDGDGEYEIIIKWTSAEKDVGSPGNPAYSGTVRFSAYKLDGTKLWDNDINLGKNVYSSAHTVQFLVYDFDGDGKSEMICQTSLGSKDAKGNYVSKSADPVNNADIYNISDKENETADFRNVAWGLITTGEEFLTVFNGETGAAVDTIALPTARGNAIDFGDANDTAGNRVNRFVSDVAYLDGEKPYAVYLRGYYMGKDGNGRQRTSIAGVSFDGERLSPDYHFDTKKGQPGYYKGAEIYVGQGNHNCTVADVDNDGKDEFITGALCMEVTDSNEFKPRWCTFMEHGDALHIGDYDPIHTGFEFFTVHEDAGPNTMSGVEVPINFGMSVIDANNGDIMLHEEGGSDTGRGMMASIGANGYYQIWSARNDVKASYGGTNFSALSMSKPSQNFRIFWDGDLYDELLDGTSVTSWNGNRMGEIFNAGSYDTVSINGTKANPALQADLFGDWREELVYPTKDGKALRVFTTTTETEFKIKTLMHDPVYRSGVAAEQTAYNQPPHVGFYMGEEVFDPEIDNIVITSFPQKTVYAVGEELDTNGLAVTAKFVDGTSKEITAYAVSGYTPDEAGKQTITVTYMGKTATFAVEVKTVSHINVTKMPSQTEYPQGSNIDTSGMVVTAYFEDGSSKVVTEYSVSKLNSDVLGAQTVTVTYMGKTTTFEVTVVPATITAINNTYETTSTESTLTEVPIGSYSGAFSFEHTVTINSLPANGSNDKASTNGYFVRFMPQVDGKSAGIGGGWYFTNSRNNIQLYWKAENATRIAQRLAVGQTYTFRYDFINVGNNNGASVTLTISDSSGNVMGSVSGLSLRNMTYSEVHLGLPLAYVQIYNQANSGSTASVTFDNARIIE